MVLAPRLGRFGIYAGWERLLQGLNAHYLPNEVIGRESYEEAVGIALEQGLGPDITTFW